MNIFILDKDPKLAAQQQCDKHVVKMCSESAQMLSTAHWATGSSAPWKSTHEGHPCTLWVQESASNYEWLLIHGLELCYEYTKRYDKIHKTQSILEWLKDNRPLLPNIELTPFAVSFYAKEPEKYNLCKREDPVESYRRFYKMDKASFAKWKLGNIPDWWNTIIL